MDNTNEDITKAHTAIDCLLMAYSAMLDYSFQGAPELRSATMEIIHALEEAITSGRTPAELLLERYYNEWSQSVDKIFMDLAY